MALGFGGTASSRSIHYMNQAKSAMDKSLLKISSGSRLVSPGDDPGGIAVAMKLRSSIATNDVAKNRVENAKSYVEMQTSTLQSVADIVSKMQTVKQDHDAASSQSEKDSYESEFQDLREQLSALKNQSFNGNQLFDRGSDLSVSTSTDGSSGAVTLGDLELAGDFLFNDPITAGNPVVDLADMSQDITLDDADADPLKRHISVTNLVDIHGKVSGMLAEAGGDASTLGFASDYLSSTATNLESALGRIEDVDLAEETTNYAALTLRYEAAAAAVAQANASADTVFNLLMGSLGKD